MELPELKGRIQAFKSDTVYKQDKKTRFVPREDEHEFWEVMYRTLAKSEQFAPPVKNIQKKINPYFGFFGERWNPATRQPGNFHTGIDVEGRRKTNIYPISDGILEYSGYGVTSGKYVMLSHPEITTQDGFTLYSLYMHLRDTQVAFTSYQKMLREISLHSYPRIAVTKDTPIGTMGDSGQSKYPKGYVHMHVQLEFRNKEGDVVFVDPAGVLGLPQTNNSTADIASEKAFMDTYVRNRKDIFKRKLEQVWKKEKK